MIRTNLILGFVATIISVQIAVATPKSEYNDTVTGIYCGQELTGLVVTQEHTGLILRKWVDSPPTTKQFVTWVKQFYAVDDANEISFQVSAVKINGCNNKLET